MSGMSWDAVNWESLERLRSAFLGGTAGAQDYWQSDADLASYDLTFAQRIGWKWDWVLAGLSRLGWTPPGGTLLDWGCGSGIAHRAFLDHFVGGGITTLGVWDRSVPATEFAARRARAKYPGLAVNSGLIDAPALLLISHVLTELAPGQLAELEQLVRRSQSVIWVEPGTFEASHALVTVRERLRSQMNLVAPCPHQASCGLLTPGNERHWCHHFAQPPGGVFTDGNWSRFARFMGIDLRSLPLSYLVLDRRPPPPMATDALRVIGRPRVYKAHATVLGCQARGVREHRLEKRTMPETFKQLKKGRFDSLADWGSRGGVVRMTGDQ